MKDFRRAWFINFSGVGNGIVIAPILRCFEESYPTISYYHTENPILANQWFLEKAGLENLKGFSPVAWRRFKEEDWQTIGLFVKERGIDLIVNLRNEGPQYDTGYYQFKAEVSKKKIPLAFWDLDFEVIERRKVQQNLTGDILTLFKIRGVDVSAYDPKWLSSIRKIESQSEGIGFGMAASQTNKRWPVAKWIALVREILANSEEDVILFPGQSEREADEAMSVLQVVGQERCKLISNESVNNIALQISRLKCFISNDTGFLHMAVTMNVPTVGLYISTNPRIWSLYNRINFFVLQNSFINKCPDQKTYCGNCFHYYDLCPAITQYGDSIQSQQVFKAIQKIVA